jgi:hypothetical protein
MALVQRVWQELKLLNGAKEEQVAVEQMRVEITKLSSHEKVRFRSTQLPESVQYRVYSSFFLG